MLVDLAERLLVDARSVLAYVYDADCSAYRPEYDGGYVVARRRGYDALQLVRAPVGAVHIVDVHACREVDGDNEVVCLGDEHVGDVALVAVLRLEGTLSSREPSSC